MQLQTLYPLFALFLFSFFWCLDLVDRAGWKTAMLLGLSRAAIPFILTVFLSLVHGIVPLPFEAPILALSATLAALLALGALGWQWWASRSATVRQTNPSDSVRGQLIGGRWTPGVLLVLSFPLLGLALTPLPPVSALTWCVIASGLTRPTEEWATRRATGSIDRQGVEIGTRQLSWNELEILERDDELQVIRFRPAGAITVRALRFDALESSRVDAVLERV